MAPSHYLNVCWFIIKYIPWHTRENDSTIACDTYCSPVVRRKTLRKWHPKYYYGDAFLTCNDRSTSSWDRYQVISKHKADMDVNRVILCNLQLTAINKSFAGRALVQQTDNTFVCVGTWSNSNIAFYCPNDQEIYTKAFITMLIFIFFVISYVDQHCGKAAFLLGLECHLTKAHTLHTCTDLPFQFITGSYSLQPILQH